MLIAVAGAAAAAALGLPVETVGERFGGFPSGLPAPSLPAFTWEKAWAVAPDALAFAMLGAIESLLSAVVADGMTGRRHRSNCELVAQGAANLAAPLFGGFCVTGTIARTATNVRAGAHGPVSGMIHALALLLFLLLLAPLAAYVPLAALAGVLAVVAWGMAERRAVAALARASRGDALVLAVTFALTVFRDLTEAIVAGVALGALLFIGRMARAAAVESWTVDDRPDSEAGRAPHPEAGPEVVVHRVSGAFFFGSAPAMDAALDRIGAAPRALVLDLAAAPVIDSSGAHALEAAARRAAGRGARVYLAGATPEARRALKALGLKPPLARFSPSVGAALDDWRHCQAGGPRAT